MSSFDTLVDRSQLATVKQLFTPEVVKQSGHLSMWGAEFEFPAAQFVIDAVVDWAKNGLYPYTITDKSYKDLVCSWMKNQRHWEIQPDWIVPVYGITASLATAMRAFTKPGEGIISLDPSYHMYWKAVELSDRKKVPSRMIYHGRDGYSVDWADLEAKMADPNNKMMVVCNPHNPTAKVYSAQELREIKRLAEKHEIMLFNDEIFAECIYEGVEMNTFGMFPEYQASVITATSLGKWLSFTGTNHANLIIPDDATRTSFLAERDKEFYGSMNPMMLPALRAAYTEEGAVWAKDMMAYVGENFKLADSYFGSQIPGFHAVRPEGTFILWVDAREFCDDAEKLKDFLINKAFFHVDPGVQYSSEPGFFRMTLSIPRAELQKNLESLKQAVAEAG